MICFMLFLQYFISVLFLYKLSFLIVNVASKDVIIVIICVLLTFAIVVVSKLYPFTPETTSQFRNSAKSIDWQIWWADDDSIHYF